MYTLSTITRAFTLAATGILLTLSTSLFAGGGEYRNSPYGHDPNPVRVYYYGYDITKPGFGIGTEVNLSWTKMEKSGCKGSRISDRQFMMIPNLGMFTNEESTQSIFGNLEFAYAVTYRHGLTIEVFGGAGYAQMLSELSSNADSNAKSTNTGSDIAYSGFMPSAGMGAGFDFQKINGKDFPLELNFRALATSTNISESIITPAFQTGLIYSF